MNERVGRLIQPINSRREPTKRLAHTAPFYLASRIFSALKRRCGRGLMTSDFFALTCDPTVRPSPALGVTTAVIGNCGFTIAPCRPADRDITMRNLTQVEGMSLDVLRQGIDWGFETFPEYLAQLRRQGSVVNVAAYIGHSSVRTYVMGADASGRAATDCQRQAANRLRRRQAPPPAALSAAAFAPPAFAVPRPPRGLHTAQGL